MFATQKKGDPKQIHTLMQKLFGEEKVMAPCKRKEVRVKTERGYVISKRQHEKNMDTSMKEGFVS